jgi:hypothetical protein
MNRHFNKLTFNCCNNVLGEKKIIWCKEKNSIGQWDYSTWCLQLFWIVPSELVVACKGFVDVEFLQRCIHNWGT